MFVVGMVESALESGIELGPDTRSLLTRAELNESITFSESGGSTKIVYPVQ